MATQSLDNDAAIAGHSTGAPSVMDKSKYERAVSRRVLPDSVLPKPRLESASASLLALPPPPAAERAACAASCAAEAKAVAALEAKLRAAEEALKQATRRALNAEAELLAIKTAAAESDEERVHASKALMHKPHAPPATRGTQWAGVHALLARCVRDTGPAEPTVWDDVHSLLARCADSQAHDDADDAEERPANARDVAEEAPEQEEQSANDLTPAVADGLRRVWSSAVRLLGGVSDAAAAGVQPLGAAVPGEAGIWCV